MNDIVPHVAGGVPAELHQEADADRGSNATPVHSVARQPRRRGRHGKPPPHLSRFASATRVACETRPISRGSIRTVGRLLGVGRMPDEAVAPALG